VAQQSFVDVFRFEPLIQQRIGLEIGHAEGELIACPPEGINQAEFVRARGVPVMVARALPNAVIDASVLLSPAGSLRVVIVGVISKSLRE
jgi:hypothetical protein